MITPWDIVWLAGLLEGEGSFGKGKNGHGYGVIATIQVAMTDRDVVARAAKLLGCNVIGPYRGVTNLKDVYRAQIQGAKAAGWMMTLYQFMGERRKARIREVLAAWKLGKARPHAVWKSSEGRLCKTCDIYKLRSEYYGAGKREPNGFRTSCKSCMSREWTARNKSQRSA